MDRETVERKYRPHLFAYCEICEAELQTNHTHDPEKEKAWYVKHFPQPLSIESRIEAILLQHGIIESALVADLTREVEDIVRGSVPCA